MLKAEGLSNRQVAEETGLDRRTIDRNVGGAKFQRGEMPHPEPEDDDYDDETPDLPSQPSSQSAPSGLGSLMNWRLQLLETGLLP